MEINVKVNDADIEDAIGAALEYGSTYWCQYKSGNFKAVCHNVPDAKPLVIIDTEDGKEYELSYARIKKGLKTMVQKSPKHFADLLSENADCWTYDALLQHCCFGELVYG